MKNSIMHSLALTAGRVASLLLAFVVLSACGGGPSNSGPAPTLPSPPPTPTPSPSPTPVSRACAGLPLGDPHPLCGTDPPVFREALYGAIDTLQAERPDIFDGSSVLSVGQYYVELIKILDRLGICGYTRDGEEIAILTSHDFSETYDILTSANRVRKFYIGNCIPASVPEPDPAPIPQPSGCSLPPSFSYACGKPPWGGEFYDDVEAAIDQILLQRPELFDYGDRAPGTGWPRVTDPGAYQNGVIAILATRGYCGLFNGEEITLKKTNEKTELYDINYADVYVRRGPGIFRGDCYPANY